MDDISVQDAYKRRIKTAWADGRFQFGPSFEEVAAILAELEARIAKLETGEKICQR